MMESAGSKRHSFSMRTAWVLKPNGAADPEPRKSEAEILGVGLHLRGQTHANAAFWETM
jgi:hypothetical protein